jgi:membrane protein DedA with SNARE-associated domain
MEHLLITHGYVAILALAIIQSFIVPIPSEVTFGYAGVLAYQHHLNIVLAIIVGTLGELVGSSIAYFVARKGGRPLIERYGKYVLVTPKDLDRAERWLDGRGEYAIAVGRALPVLRLFVSWIAGIAEMTYAKFAAFSFIGTLVYGSVLAGIGYGVGSAWTTVLHDFKLAGYVLAAIAVLGILAIARHRFVELHRSKAEAVR